MQAVKSKGSFLTEALIISLSSFLVKIIGVVYKVPLADMLGTSMSVFNAAYSIYSMLFMLSTSGLPTAISRMVAAAAEKGRRIETGRILTNAVLVLGVIGTVFSVSMFVFAEPLAVWSKHPDAVNAIKVISPTLLFICLTAAFRGYFQGLHNMYPTAISQFIEAFFKLTLGLGAAYYAQQAGYSTVEQAAFAVSGLTVGVFFGMCFLMLYKRFGRKYRFGEVTRECMTDGEILRGFVHIAAPAAITSSALYMTHFLDTLVINQCLVGVGYELSVADDMYSAYTTLATSLSDLVPSTLVYPVAVSILPAVSAAIAVGRSSDVRRYCMQSLRMSSIISCPFALCMAVLAKPCISLIYGSGWGGSVTLLSGETVTLVDLASGCLSILSIGMIFISMLSTSNALLQAIGKVTAPMKSVLTGVVLLVAVQLALMSIPAVGIYGAPIATLVCYFTALMLNLKQLKSALPKLKLTFKRLFFKPLFCSAASAVVCIVVYGLLSALLGGNFSRLASAVYLLASAVAAVPVYVILMLKLNGITASEVALLPKGNAISRFLLSKGLLKQHKKTNI